MNNYAYTKHIMQVLKSFKWKILLLFSFVIEIWISYKMKQIIALKIHYYLNALSKYCNQSAIHCSCYTCKYYLEHKFMFSLYVAHYHMTVKSVLVKYTRIHVKHLISDKAFYQNASKGIHNFNRNYLFVLKLIIISITKWNTTKKMA